MKTPHHVIQADSCFPFVEMEQNGRSLSTGFFSFNKIQFSEMRFEEHCYSLYPFCIVEFHRIRVRVRRIRMRMGMYVFLCSY